MRRFTAHAGERAAGLRGFAFSSRFMRLEESKGLGFKFKVIGS